MMKKISLILLLSVLVDHNSFATTLSEALQEAYINNPVLNAERENIQVSKEDLNISRGEFLPTIILSGSKSKQNTEKQTDRNGVNSAITDVDPKSQSIVIEQKIFQGFAGLAGIEKSKIGLNLADARLLKTEQDILYKAVEAYSGLVFAGKKLKINQNNIYLLERQVETDQARLERGQITLADLAQSESSLAGAQANFIQARNGVVTAKLVYEKIIGPINNLSILNEK
ncbi:TolC family protein [Candidatus Pelagibacter sp.]|nr:TolC family protein [Candidatus Pelagibacter sp.]